MTIKLNTIERFRKWANNSAPTDIFTTGTDTYTRAQFEQMISELDAPQPTLNNTEEQTHADLATALHDGDIEEY